METIVAKDSAESSIQDGTKIINDPNDNFIIPNDSFYKLIEKQAKGFEEIGKKMGLNLQNSYKEYLVHQDGTINLEMDPIEMEEVHKKYEEEIASHSQIINSLRARIEELEADSIAKDQDIKELRQEFNNLILT